MLDSPLRGVGGVDCNDSGPDVVGHLGEPVAQLLGRQPKDVLAEGVASSGSRRTVTGVLATLDALADEVEVLDDDCPGVVGRGDGEHLGDRGPDVTVSMRRRQPVENERERGQHAERVAEAVEDRYREMTDVHIDGYHRLSA